MSLGTGGFIPKSRKQKLNTKSSTEAELVGASDYLPNTMWVKNFLEAQGYDIVENYLEQDNESAIKMEKNGRSSAGPRSRHIDIRYFWIKDRTESNGIRIRHCPTLQMLADFFTKPLQGVLFTKFRDVLLGYEHIDSLALDPTSTLEERVGGTEKRANGRGTDGPDCEEITDLLEESTGGTWADVVRKGVDRNSERMRRANKDVVSGDHSLETIPLMK
jgi:hypothetical protein